MYGSDICKPLLLVAGEVFGRVFLYRRAVCIANKINESAIKYENRTLEITLLCPCVKSTNKCIGQNRLPPKRSVP